MASRSLASHPAVDDERAVSREAMPKSRRDQTRRKSEPSMAERSPQPPDSRMNRIAERAHEIYVTRGGEHGKALEDWLQANAKSTRRFDNFRGSDPARERAVL
jgi:hypothetical protein